MSYLSRKHTSHRTATIIAVTVIEAAAIYGLVLGLQNTFTRDPPPKPLVGVQMPLDPPPPVPTPSVQPSPQADPIVTPRHAIAVSMPNFPTAPLPLPTSSPVPLPLPTPDAIIETPKPPQFAPRSAKPLGRVGSWATPNDYPARDLREGNAGVTGFRLEIGSDGKVKSCTVTRSSGFAGLDQATCENVSRRARFEAATDETGARVAGSYSNNIRWVIPE